MDDTSPFGIFLGVIDDPCSKLLRDLTDSEFNVIGLYYDQDGVTNSKIYRIIDALPPKYIEGEYFYSITHHPMTSRIVKYGLSESRWKHLNRFDNLRERFIDAITRLEESRLDKKSEFSISRDEERTHQLYKNILTKNVGLQPKPGHTSDIINFKNGYYFINKILIEVWGTNRENFENISESLIDCPFIQPGVEENTEDHISLSDSSMQEILDDSKIIVAKLAGIFVNMYIESLDFQNIISSQLSIFFSRKLMNITDSRIGQPHPPRYSNPVKDYLSGVSGVSGVSGPTGVSGPSGTEGDPDSTDTADNITSKVIDSIIELNKRNKIGIFERLRLLDGLSNFITCRGDYMIELMTPHMDLFHSVVEKILEETGGEKIPIIFFPDLFNIYNGLAKSVRGNLINTSRYHNIKVNSTGSIITFNRENGNVNPTRSDRGKLYIFPAKGAELTLVSTENLKHILRYLDSLQAVDYRFLGLQTAVTKEIAMRNGLEHKKVP